jgi:WS/DGAT/MGAT family acyltransferase
MTDTEAIMWAVEKDPALRSDFCNLTLLDGRPTDDRIDATLTRALAAIPRLGQRVIGAPLRIAPPEFADDPTLDLEAHLKEVAVPAPGDDRALLDLVGALAEQPLDRARPLWEFTLITGLTGGRAAVLQKVHHAVTDGVGALKLSLALVDFERNPEPKFVPGPRATALPRHDTPSDATRRAVNDAAARGIGAVLGAVGSAARVVTSPTDLPRRAGDTARFMSSVQRQLLVTDRARSDVLTGRSLRRRFETRALSMPALHAAAANLGGSLNDAYVTGLAAALGRYHARLGSSVDALRLAMPVSTRAAGDNISSNAFAPARVVVPIQPAHDLAALFKDVHARLDVAKHERVLSAASGFAAVASGLPTSLLVSFTRAQTRTIDFAASNLRGSPVALYLAGQHITANYPFGPRTGTPLNVTMVSYCDDLHFGINIDPAAITDIDAFMRDIDGAYRDLLEYA